MEETQLLDRELFAQRYQVRRQIGKGGMGKVYLVVDKMLNDEVVALKVLRSDYGSDEKHIQRFVREVQLTRKITHPNVVRTFDAGICDGQLYFTMEYIDGPTLKDKVKQGLFNALEVADIIQQVAKGLDAIHEGEIVHRDVKPGNMLQTKDGVIKIADFGVARPGLSDLTGHNEIVGSTAYMAPEVWVGRNVGTQSDLYALGICAYELLTGTLPFEAESPAELMCKHLEFPPTPPSEHIPDIPKWLEKLILALLEKDPNQRPCNAKEIEEYVAGCLASIDQGLAEAQLDDLAIEELSTSTDPFEYHSVMEDPGVVGHEPGYYSSRPVYDDEFEEMGIGAKLPEHTQIETEKQGTEDAFSTPSTQTAINRAPGARREGKGIVENTSPIKRIGIGVLVLSIISYLLFDLGVDMVVVTWKKAELSLELNYVILAGISVGLHHGLVCAWPILVIASFKHHAKEACRIWFCMAVGVIFILIFLFLVNGVQVYLKCRELNQTVPVSSVLSVIEPSADNLFQAAMLQPSGTTFKAAQSNGLVGLKRMIGEGVSVSASYFVALFLYLFLLASFILKSIWGNAHVRYAMLAMKIFCFGGSIILFQIFCRPWIESLMQQAALNKYPIRSGAFFTLIDNYSFGCSIFNWALVLIMLLVFYPLYRSFCLRKQGPKGS